MAISKHTQTCAIQKISYLSKKAVDLAQRFCSAYPPYSMSILGHKFPAMTMLPTGNCWAQYELPMVAI